jgi:hypothetical protein
MKAPKNRTQKGARSLIVLGMILTRKGGTMKHKNAPRGGAKNKQAKYLSEA